MPDQGRVIIVDPAGQRHVFPVGFDPKKASEIVRQRVSTSASATPEPPTTPTWSDALGLNAPTDSKAVGFFRGAGAGAVDLAQGVVSNITGQMNTKLDTENAFTRSQGMGERATMPRVETPENFSGTVGSVLPVVAETVIGGGSAARTAINALPSSARAARNFQTVMGAARNIPLDVRDVGDVALRINQLAERGGSMPMAVRKLLNRMTDPNQAPLVYEEGRDFASNISRLSADEFGRLTPVVAREVANLRVALSHANATAARQAGRLEEYHAAMLEYARAARVRNVIDAAIKGLKKSAPYATVGGAAGWIGQRLAARINQ